MAIWRMGRESLSLGLTYLFLQTFEAARRDGLVAVRDELDTSGQRFDRLMTSNGYLPVREMAPSIGAGFSHMEMAGDEGIGARCGRGCLRGERGDFDSRAFSLQRVVVKQCITGAGCHDRVGIGTHRAYGVPIVIEGAMPCSARSARIRLQYSSPARRIKTRVAGVTLSATLCISLRCGQPEPLPGCSALEA
jgi:hypothetical protein